MAKTGHRGLKRIFNAAIYSAKGLGAAFRHEEAFRQEVLLAVVMIPLACWLEVSSVERALLISSVLLLLVVELCNSAVEAVVDRIGSEHHELSGRAKDIGSAAVFVCFVLLLANWVVILWPYVAGKEL